MLCHPEEEILWLVSFLLIYLAVTVVLIVLVDVAVKIIMMITVICRRVYS